MIYKFVAHETNIENIKGSKAYSLYNKLVDVKGDLKKLNDEDKKNIEAVFSELWHMETYKSGKYKIMGYIIDFSEFLKTYYVKTKYNGIHEIKSFNKTYIRKNSVTPSQILKIIEI